VDHLAVANIQAHVAKASPEDEVAGLELVAIDPATRLILGPRAP
jgi:hypothetical protein